MDQPFAPAPYQGYQAPPPMMTGAVPGAYNEPPKFAQFAVGPNGHAIDPPKVNDDALPPMPSWDTAAKKRVLTEEERDAVEMGELDPTTGQKVPLMSGAAISRTGSPAISPDRSPYGDDPSQGYMGAAGAGIGAAAIGAGGMAMHGRGNGGDPYSQGGRGNGADPYSQGGFNGNGRGNQPAELYARNGSVGSQGGYNNNNNNGYGRGNPSDPYARNGPADQRGGYNGNPSDRGYGQQGQAISPTSGPGQSYPGGPNQAYTEMPGDNTYNNSQNGPGGFGAIAAPYPRAQPQRQYTGDSNRPFPPSQPQRQYSNDSSRPSINTGRGMGINNGPSQRPYQSEDPYSRQGQGQQSPPLSQQPRRSPPPSSYAPSSVSSSAYQPRRPSPPTQQYPQNSNSNYAPSTAPPSYASRSPPPNGPAQSYTGYQSYQTQPPAQGRGPPAALLPAGRNPAQGRGEQGWNPV